MTLASDLGIDIRDYDHDAQDRGWGTGWPQCGGAAGNVVTVVAPRSGARFPVHRKIARIVSIALDYLENELGYILDPTQCGANNCRPISGTNVSSNHAWAIALDIMWRLNPYKCGARYTIPLVFVEFMESIGFAWGGRYCDYMHFEWMGTPEQADWVTEALLTGYTPGQVKPTLTKGDSGPAVTDWQTGLRNMGYNVTVDGVFGDQTEVATKQFQTSVGLPADGVVGPSTWAALLSQGAEEMSFEFEYDDTPDAEGFGTFRAWGTCEGPDGTYAKWSGLRMTAIDGLLKAGVFFVNAPGDKHIPQHDLKLNIPEFYLVPEKARDAYIAGRHQVTGTANGKPARLSAKWLAKPK